MKKHLMLEIDCGDRTCSSEPGKFCRHVLTKRFGTVWVCGLFRTEEGSEILLKDENGGEEGSLMRCGPCLEAECE